MGRLPAEPGDPALPVPLRHGAAHGRGATGAVDWRGREGIYTAHEMLGSYHLTDDGRVVGGAKAVRYGYGGRALAGHDRAPFPTLEAAFRTRFPELRAVAMTHRWGGPIAFALDFLPAVGRTGRCASPGATPARGLG